VKRGKGKEKTRWGNGGKEGNILLAGKEGRGSDVKGEKKKLRTE